MSEAPPQEYLSPKQLAERWPGGPSVKTLAQWRYLGIGPDYTRVGKSVVYPLASVLEFERTNTVRTGAA
ncbi:hypothetical protein [Nocardia farcinica]